MHVYVFSAGDMIQKVGVTGDIDRRAGEVACASGRPILEAFHGITPHAREVEKEIHRILAPRRTRGEWFAVSVDEAEAAFDAAWEAVHGFPIDPYVWTDPWAAS